MLKTIFGALAASALLLSSAASAGSLLLIHHKVADYAKWRAGFDAHKSMQDAAGLTNAHVYQAVTNPNDVTITFDVGDLDKAKAFVTSKDLKEAMKKAGVKGKPDISLLNAAP
jgi:hypothetical protein